MSRWSINIPLSASVAAIAFAVIVMSVQLSSLASAMLTPRLQDDPTRARLDEYLVEHETSLGAYRDRVEGRSLFFKPKPYPRPEKPAPKIVDRDPVEPVPPPEPAGPPSTYSGPRILFVLGDEVWFHNGMHLSVGEESDGVTVIASSAPWSITLGHDGGEYDIDLFKRSSLFDGGPPRSKPMVGLKIVDESRQRNQP